ncbi:GNAT family N-acetyltransferase (plasmid) [Agrobacterium tumefaciens]|uniref:GNAT family N-acetyltransferase n=1 Tax=Agrobacterium tumefaciens TaxID=358 RepID=A0AAJ4N9S4_AGRTU|nr:GNAT family N-acetyltransferase [Agrobacterium tumefaciens]
MKIYKSLPAENLSKVPGYMKLQRDCIANGAQADLYTSQTDDLIQHNVRLYTGHGSGSQLIAGAFTRRDGNGGAELCGVVVDIGHRGRGLGTELVQYIVGSEFAAGARRLELVVRIYVDGKLNEKAARLYRSVGFMETGEVRTGQISDDPRVRNLAGSVDSEGRYRAAVFELLAEADREVRYG